MQIKVKESRKKNEDFQFNSDKENWGSTYAFKKFEDESNLFYTILATAKKDKVEKILKDYVDSDITVMKHGPIMSIIPMVSKYTAQDISEDLTKAGIEHCVYKQTFTMA